MSNFKIQIFNQSSQLQIKRVVLPQIPKISINLQTIPLLNYPLDHLIEIINTYFSQLPPDKLHILKTLKILTHSLGDSNLMSKIQLILSSKIRQQYKVYNLLILWSSVCKNISRLLHKFSDNLRKQLVKIIFRHYLLDNNYGQEHLKVQLGQLLIIQNKTNLLNDLKKKYKQFKVSLKLCVKKCVNIKTQNIQLMKFLREWAQFCLSNGQNEILELTKEYQQLNYLIQNVPNMASIFIKQLKTIINQSNINNFKSQNIKINLIYQSAIKQWVNETDNYWKLVNRWINNNSNEYFYETIKLGKELNKQNVQNQMLMIKYLYFYLQGCKFNFAYEDNRLNIFQKESWMDIYRGITLCNSYNRMNLAIISINSSIKWWNPVNPFKQKSKNDKLNKFIDKHDDFFKQKQRQYGDKNKRLQIVYSTFLIVNRQNKTQFILTYDQLNLYLENKLDINMLNFKKQYTPFKIEIKQNKQQSKKEHNIIIQAKLVKLLKKHKESLTIQFLNKQSGYSIEMIELAVKRLISKGLAEQDQKGKGYNYVP